VLVVNVAGGAGAQPSRDELMEAITSGDVTQRVEAAWELHLPIEGMRRASEDTHVQVVESLLTNIEVPEEIIAGILQKHPELHQAVMSHPNAPIAMKEALPMVWHTALTLSRYADQRGWSQEHLEGLIEAANALPDPFTTTLGQLAAELDPPR